MGEECLKVDAGSKVTPEQGDPRAGKPWYTDVRYSEPGNSEPDLAQNPVLGSECHTPFRVQNIVRCCSEVGTPESLNPIWPRSLFRVQNIVRHSGFRMSNITVPIVPLPTRGDCPRRRVVDGDLARDPGARRSPALADRRKFLRSVPRSRVMVRGLFRGWKFPKNSPTLPRGGLPRLRPAGSYAHNRGIATSRGTYAGPMPMGYGRDAQGPSGIGGTFGTGTGRARIIDIVPTSASPPTLLMPDPHSLPPPSLPHGT
eukprot:gene12038-biopygen8123